ncbi:uncharacterized protein LOC114122057 isoform X5 [Aphis gossypii]|uniref:uncharacterized protein LOC114122057 isoform X5 n=1 Tax=Aphis gossypii TaxID=80765 RepID=UPI002158E895|nr:uncharacterized protein LOC114122057 isoform X5 [Aphis gossypii]
MRSKGRPFKRLRTTAPKTPKSHETPKTSDILKISEMSEIPDSSTMISETSMIPEMSQTSKMSEISDTFNMSEMSEEMSDILPMNELLGDVPTESTSNPPINELTNGLKRSLPDGVDNDRDSDMKKKIRLVDTSEDELEVTSKDDSGKDDSEKDHIEMLIQRVDQITESLETTIGIESNISDDTHNLNCETNLSLKMVNHNGNSGLDDKPCMEDSSDKNTLCTDVSKDIEDKPTDTSNINNNCKFIGNSEETEKNGKNKLVEKDIITSNGISDLNRSSSSDNLVIDENDDHENVNCVVNDSPIAEKISTTVNDSTVTEHNLNNSHSKISNIKNIVYSKTNGVELVPVIENSIQSAIKGTEETKTIESDDSTEFDVPTNCNNQDFEVIDSDSSSNISLSDLTDLPDNINNIIQGVRQMSKESFPHLLQLFSTKELTYDQFDSLCTQKIIEMMTERLYWGKDRAELQLLKEREKHWRSKYISLNRQVKEIKTIINLHKLDLKTNEHAKPHIITRTVGLQAVLFPKKEGSVKLPKSAIPMSKPEDNPVNIISDDEDDVIIESAKPSTSKTENSTPKKQIYPSINKSKSPVVSPPKTVPIVPAAKSSDLTNDTLTIDLTGSDDITDASNVEEPISPFKVLHRQSPGILPAQVGTSNRTAVSNKDTISPKPTNLKPYILEVSRVDPVLVQPCTVAYTTQRVPISNISGTLQPIPTVPYTPRQITVSQLSASLKPLTSTSYTACQLPTSSRMSGSLPQASPGTTFTACRLPISIHAIPAINVGPQLSRPPPPPAIPILEHPAPLPPVPNQRSLPSWKKLPPAPKVSLSKTVESSRIPQALVLSWNMTMNRLIADVVSYQIYAYQEVPNQPPKAELWKKIGDVNALPLPMACSLTQFSSGEKYHFAVRAVDVYSRIGPFSLPQSTFISNV